MYTRTYTCYNKLRQNYPGAHNYTEQPVTEDPDLANVTFSDTTHKWTAKPKPPTPILIS